MSPVVYRYSAWALLLGGFALSGLQALQVRDEIERDAHLALNMASDQFALQIYDGGEALPSTLLYSSERQLGESEARWKFVLDHTDEGIWEWDVSTETVNFSRRWKDLLGYGEHDLGTALAEWERRVHPDDLEAVKTAMRATLKGHNMSFEHEHRMLCKDGSWRRVRDSGLVVSRDREGRPLRVLGTLKDLGPA